MNSIFIEALDQQLRFAPARGAGQLTTEDLFRTPLKDLDAMAVSIVTDLEKSSGSRSFLTNPDSKATAAKKAQELRLEILKFVIAVREDSNRQKAAAASASRQKEFLLSLKSKRQVETLESLTEEEIDARLRDLEG